MRPKAYHGMAGLPQLSAVLSRWVGSTPRRSPKKEKTMSDYNPGPGGYDKYGNTNFEPGDPGGRGPYILLGILVAIGLIGGLLYFNGGQRGGDRANQAQAPSERSMTAQPRAPSPMAPAPAAPAPAAPSSTDNGATQKQ